MIEISPTWHIGADTHNWILYKRRVSKNPDGDSDETYSSDGYYTRLEGLLRTLRDHLIKAKVTGATTTVETLLAAIEASTEELQNALERIDLTQLGTQLAATKHGTKGGTKKGVGGTTTSTVIQKEGAHRFLLALGSVEAADLGKYVVEKYRKGRGYTCVVDLTSDEAQQIAEQIEAKLPATTGNEKLQLGRALEAIDELSRSAEQG